MLLFFISAITDRVTALFATAGIKSQAIIYQEDWGVTVATSIAQTVGSARWQIHEIPVDFSIDPKLRCRPEHVGRFMYSGVEGWDNIYGGVTTTSLAMHSIVIFVDNEPVTCGSIVPFALPTSTASIEFKSGAFGRIYILQWPGEHSLHACIFGDCARNVNNNNITTISSLSHHVSACAHLL